MKTRTFFAAGLILALIGLSSVPTFTLAATSSKKDIKKLLNKRNILAVPNLSSQVTTYTVSSATQSKVSVKASPPTLQSIPGKPIKELFWGKIDGVNVIDSLNTGNPSPNACKEFYNGSEDGQSGGLGACHLAESVGFAYSTIVESGQSSCFIKSFPTKSVLKSGAITVNSGAFPDSDIEKLFSAPSGDASRIVKINVGGTVKDVDAPRIIFIEVPTKSANAAAKQIYSANLWFCDSEGNSVTGYDKIKISNSLQFTVEHGDVRSKGSSLVTAVGFLTKKGNNLIWNADKTRTATTLAKRGDFDRFKSDIEITNDEQIKLKRLDNRDNKEGRAFLFTKYSGNTAENLRFLQGAFNELHREDPIISAVDFNGTFYETDTGSSLLSTANSANLDEDFYNSSLDVNVDFSPYSCGITPDIELTLDGDNQALGAIMSECRPISPDNMRFCHQDTEVNQAEQVFREKCTRPPTPTPRPTNPSGPPPKK